MLSKWLEPLFYNNFKLTFGAFCQNMGLFFTFQNNLLCLYDAPKCMFDVDLFKLGTVVQKLELAIDTQANIQTVPKVHYFGFRGPKVQNAKDN